MTARSYSRRSGVAGLTLVELMIAMTLGLFLLLGLVNVFLAQRQAYRTNENLAQLQSNARVAFELLAREIRESGTTLCGAQVVGNVVVNANASPWLDWSLGGIQGFEGDQTMPVVNTGTATAQRVAGTDGLMIRSGSLMGGTTIADHAATASPIVLNTATHGLVTGNVLIACDYTQAAIFQATNASPSSPNIAHAVGGGTPGNCSDGFPLACPPSGSQHKFDTNGFVAPLSVTAWYIGNNARGGRSLFRILNNGTPQEIAVGIADLQLQYLTRTGTTPATSYVDADDPSITSWAPTADPTVIAVRVVLDLESEEAVGTDGDVLKRQLMYVVSRRGFRETL